MILRNFKELLMIGKDVKYGLKLRLVPLGSNEILFEGDPNGEAHYEEDERGKQIVVNPMDTINKYLEYKIWSVEYKKEEHLFEITISKNENESLRSVISSLSHKQKYVVRDIDDTETRYIKIDGICEIEDIEKQLGDKKHILALEVMEIKLLPDGTLKILID